MWVSISLSPHASFFLDLPGSFSASFLGYLSSGRADNLIAELRRTSPRAYSGIMLWDAARAVGGQNLAAQINEEDIQRGCSGPYPKGYDDDDSYPWLGNGGDGNYYNGGYGSSGGDDADDHLSISDGGRSSSISSTHLLSLHN
jgi:hypothetical protein